MYIQYPKHIKNKENLEIFKYIYLENCLHGTISILIAEIFGELRKVLIMLTIFLPYTSIIMSSSSSISENRSTIYFLANLSKCR